MRRILPLLLAASTLAGPLDLAADQSAVTTVISSMVRREHRRATDAQGRWRREHYVLLMGGPVQGTIADRSVLAVDRATLAGAVARELARQNYHVAPDSKSAQLMILVHWGKTVIRPNAELLGTVSPSAFSTEDDLSQLDFQQREMDEKARENAVLLGLGAVYGHDVRSWLDLYDDETLFGPRYYMILSAYDSRRVGAGEKKLLWRTRLSISALNEKFDDKFMQMLASASKHFGQPTENVVHQYSEPEVIIGTPEVIGIVPDRMPEASDQRK